MPTPDYYKKSAIQTIWNGYRPEGAQPTYDDIDEDKFRAYAAQKYGEGTDFYEQALNAYNAYKSKQWNPNIWQQGAANLLGDNSAFLSWQNDRLSILEDSLSRIGDASHQEQYNSAAAQADRLREAGLNPDLAGGVEAGEAGDLDNLEAARAPINDGSSSLGQIADTAMSVLGFSMQMAQNFQSLGMGDLKIAGDTLSLLSGTDDFLLSQIGNRLSENDIRSLIALNEGKSSDEYYSAYGRLKGVLGDLYEDKRLPRKVRKALREWNGRIDSDSIGVDKKLLDLIAGKYGSKRAAIEGAGHPFTSGGFEESLKTFGDHIQQTIINIQKLQSKYSEHELKTGEAQLSYEDARLGVTGENGESLGTLAGKADASAFTSEAYQKEYDAEVNKMWSGIMSDLKKHDTWWSNLLQFAIPIIRLALGNLRMPSVSRTTSMGVDKKGNPVKNSSSSFAW